MRYWLPILLVFGVLSSAVVAQDHSARLGDVKRGGRVSFEPTGPGVLFDALDPVVRKWYVPQELYAEYGWRQREYSNYDESDCIPHGLGLLIKGLALLRRPQGRRVRARGSLPAARPR